ncbi:MAG: hypothetical protein J6V71_00085 [Clostridia bacterium]|nr:hypothetical protein [Clostridia bacterium]
MYYKIRLSFDHDEDGCAWVEEYVNVENLEEAEKRVPQIAKDYKIPKEYDVDIQETSIDEMIECEKEEHWSKIRNHYMYRKYDMDMITIRQFADVQKELKKDKDKIYEMLKDESRYIRICELLKKKIDKRKVTISEFEQIVLELYNAKTNEECEKIFKEKVNK